MARKSILQAFHTEAQSASDRSRGSPTAHNLESPRRRPKHPLNACNYWQQFRSLQTRVGQFNMLYLNMSSDLKVLAGGLCKSGHCIRINGFAKVPRWRSRKESSVFAKVLRNTGRQNVWFQEIPLKMSRKIRNSSVIVTTKENASSIGRGPCPVNREL